MRRIRCWFDRWRLCLALSLLVPLAASAQDDRKSDQPWTIGARSHFGFLWPHRPTAWYLVNGHAAAFALDLERRFRDRGGWERSYNGPGYGFGLMYSGMANPDVIGGGLRFIPYLHLPFVRGDHGSFGMRLGWGVGYIFRPFHRTENYKQIATGTRINTAIQLMFEYRIDLRRLRLSTGLSIDHWSNGSVKLPNLGLNLVSVSLGAGYAFNDRSGSIAVPDTSSFQKRSREQSIVASFGISEVARPLSGQYSAFSLVAQTQWQVSRKSSFSVGIDIFNKGSLRTVHRELRDQDRITHTQFGVHGGWALGFGRGELLLQMGAYVYTPYPDESPLFHRLGMRYRIADRWIAHVGLKSHWAVADHWEWGFGYRWH